MKSMFKLIDDLNRFMDGFPYPWCVAGGWAIDLFIGRQTRDRCDLDISVSQPGFRPVTEWILGRNWTVEGKKGGGFKRVNALGDLDEDIRYFWSFPQGAAFISEYVDDAGNRRISYDRAKQETLDYIEVFSDTFENGEFVYRREPGIRRRAGKAILERNGCRFLAPELVLLYKSTRIRPTDEYDHKVALPAMDTEQREWLQMALLQIYGEEHAWVGVD